MQLSFALASLVLSTSIFAQDFQTIAINSDGSTTVGGVTYNCGSNAAVGVYNGEAFCCVNGNFINPPGVIGARVNTDLAGRDPAALPAPPALITAPPAFITAAPIVKRKITSSVAPSLTCVGDYVSVLSSSGIAAASTSSGIAAASASSKNATAPTSSKNVAAPMGTRAPLLVAGGLGFAIAYGAI